MGSYLFSFLIMGLLVWFWVDSMRARETLLAICKKTCRSMQVSLLDETVFVSRMRLGRNAHGTLQLRRWYEFEVCTDGLNRYPGCATLLGQQIEDLQLHLPDGPVLTANPGQGLH